MGKKLGKWVRKWAMVSPTVARIVATVAFIPFFEHLAVGVKPT